MATASHRPLESVHRIASYSNVGLLIGSIVASFIASLLMPATMRIQWHIGTYEHWGSERVATEPLLIAFPLMVAAVFFVMKGVVRYMPADRADGRTAVEIALAVMLVAIVSMQILLIGLNMIAG